MAGPTAFQEAGITHKDVDHLMIYDAFAHLPLYGLEDLGFVKRGEAAAFVGERNRAVGIAFAGCHGIADPGDQQIAQTAREFTERALESFERFEFSKALESIWSLIGAVDKYIVEQAPWKLVKEGESAAKKLDEVLFTAAEALRVVTELNGASFFFTDQSAAANPLFAD